MKTTYEYVGNMHMHTPYSDGAGYHTEIAQAALRAKLDFIIVTDHNVHVGGVEGYVSNAAKDRRVLLLVGEEVHDRCRDPQANHMLIYGADRELAAYASNPQALIDEALSMSGICYLAHPIEVAAPQFNEDALPWVNWNLEGFVGIELWNYMSEFKSCLSNRIVAVRAAFNPEAVITGPFPETLALWDRLLKEGKRIKVIGGADAHATTYTMGPIRRVIFPYEYLFCCVNTHILLDVPLPGDVESDKKLVLAALRNGTAFIGYDLPHPTTGFHFSAQGHNTNVIMGDWIRLGHGVTLQIVVPRVCRVRLIRDGEMIFQADEGTHHTYIAGKPGAYRVEAYIPFKGKTRGWIFSNPIFVTE